MKYFLAIYELIDGEHEYIGAVILEAENKEEAWKIAEAEEHFTDTQYTDEEVEQGKLRYFDVGDGTTAARNRSCQEISREQMQFLEQVGLAYRMECPHG
jgi:hypothetical protein